MRFFVVGLRVRLRVRVVDLFSPPVTCSCSPRSPCSPCSPRSPRSPCSPCSPRSSCSPCSRSTRSGGSRGISFLLTFAVNSFSFDSGVLYFFISYNFFLSNTMSIDSLFFLNTSDTFFNSLLQYFSSPSFVMSAKSESKIRFLAI